MRCPYCENKKTKVVSTDKYDTVILRVRQCPVCKKYFETQEILYRLHHAKKDNR